MFLKRNYSEHLILSFGMTLHVSLFNLAQQNTKIAYTFRSN